MKKSNVNYGQLLVSLVTLALMFFIPFSGFNFGFVSVLQSSLLTLAIHVNPLLLLIFLVLAVELLVSFTNNHALSLGSGVVGLLLGILVASLLGTIVTSGNFGWITNNLSLVYNLLPDSLKSQLPAEINPTNLETLKQIVLSFYKGSIGLWLYIGSQLFYMLFAFLPKTAGMSGSSNVQTPARPRTY